MKSKIFKQNRRLTRLTLIPFPTTNLKEKEHIARVLERDIGVNEKSNNFSCLFGRRYRYIYVRRGPLGLEHNKVLSHRSHALPN